MSLLLLAACGSGVGTLTITEPAGGTVVNAETTTVRGTAPADTEVIWDIPARPDQRTLSDAQGAWRMEVQLEVGDNVLTFRLADDDLHESEKSVLVVRER